MFFKDKNCIFNFLLAKYGQSISKYNLLSPKDHIKVNFRNLKKNYFHIFENYIIRNKF